MNSDLKRSTDLLNHISANTLNGIKPEIDFMLPEFFTPEITLYIFKKIWISQLCKDYMEIQSESIFDKLKMKIESNKSFKKEMICNIINEYGFSSNTCRQRILLLKAYWTYMLNDKRFEVEMQKTIRIKKAMATDIYAKRRMEVFDRFSLKLTKDEFDDLYKNIEAKYEEVKDEFCQIKEEQLYRWEPPPSKVKASIMGFLSNIGSGLKKLSGKVNGMQLDSSKDSV